MFDCSVYVGQTKCHRYWPGTQSEVYGDITVEMMSEKELADWTFRELRLTKVSSLVLTTENVLTC